MAEPKPKTVRVEELPDEVQALVMVGWHAVVFDGKRVYGVFPQLVLAHGYIGAVTDFEDREGRAMYQVVSK